MLYFTPLHHAFSLLYCFKNVLCFDRLSASMLREADGMLRYSSAFSLKQLHQLIDRVFAHSLGSRVPDKLRNRRFWYYCHGSHHEWVQQGGYISFSVIPVLPNSPTSEKNL